MNFMSTIDEILNSFGFLVATSGGWKGAQCICCSNGALAANSQDRYDRFKDKIR